MKNSENKILTLIMPISFTGFGPTALIVMVLFLAVAQGIKHIRHHKSH